MPTSTTRRTAVRATARRSPQSAIGPASEFDFISSVLNTTAALIMVFDAEGRNIRFNRACEEASGYTEREVAGKSFWELGLVPDAELDGVREVAAQLFAGNGPIEHENHWRHRDGTVRLLRWINAAICDEAGNVRYVVASALDITAGRAIREQLRAERDLLDALLETAPAIVVVADAQGRIVRFNRAAELSSGRTFEELEGIMAFDLLLAPEDAEATRDGFARILAGDSPQSTETSWLHRDGSRRLVSWTSSGLAGPDGKITHVVGAGVDITARREAERHERQQLEELSHLHRLHVAGELATLLAHELNQPLAAIASYAEAGQQGAATDADVAERRRTLFQRIGEQALRAGAIVRDLRTFLAKRPAAKVSFDPGETIRHARDLTVPYARSRGVSVDLDLVEVRLVVADPVQLEHAIVNLVRNGIEAIAGNGMASGRVTLRLGEHRGMARITVEDTGPGVRPEDARRLFEPLFTTRPDGLGMGLRVTRRLMEANDGRVDFEPRASGGVFHLHVPLAR